MSDSHSGSNGGYRIELENVRGRPDTIANDLDRADGRHADECGITVDVEDLSVVITVDHDNAAKWLYDWLEDTRQYYKENYVDASGEHDAARDMADAVYEKVKS